MAGKRNHYKRDKSAGSVTLHHANIPSDIRRTRVYCRTCDLWGYPTRKTAKRHARHQYPDKGLTPFPCPQGAGWWHFGHRGAAR